MCYNDMYVADSLSTERAFWLRTPNRKLKLSKKNVYTAVGSLMYSIIAPFINMRNRENNEIGVPHYKSGPQDSKSPRVVFLILSVHHVHWGASLWNWIWGGQGSTQGISSKSGEQRDRARSERKKAHERIREQELDDILLSVQHTIYLLTSYCTSNSRQYNYKCK
jgi:hypothetical protein